MQKSDCTKVGRAAAGPHLPYLDNERGMLLVMTMVVLLVLSGVAATNIINAYLERSLAKNQHYATISLNAADAGLDYGLTWLIENPGSIDYGNLATWEQTLTGGLGSGGDYDVTISFLKDEEDLDGDGDTTDIVYYNKCTATIDATAGGCYGYPDSIYNIDADTDTDPPYPVIKINAVGAYGEAGKRDVDLTVARNGFDIKAYGAVTAASSVNTTGSITVDGRGHGENGDLCDSEAGGTANCTCEDTYPGVTVEDGATFTPGGAATTDGDATHDPDGDGSAPISALPGGLSVPFSPDDALGLPEGSLEDMLTGGLPAPGATKVSGNVTYINASYTWNLDSSASGIIIVHNPLFNPRQWKVSVPTIPNPAGGAQIANPDLNPADGDYSAALNADYDSTKAPYAQDVGEAFLRRPRNVDQHGNSTFKGVVIADSIDKINGNCTIIGAMISLSTIATNILGNGSAEIKYSCDAINMHTSQGYGTKLAWHRRF